MSLCQSGLLQRMLSKDAARSLVKNRMGLVFFWLLAGVSFAACWYLCLLVFFLLPAGIFCCYGMPGEAKCG